MTFDTLGISRASVGAEICSECGYRGEGPSLFLSLLISLCWGDLCTGFWLVCH